MISKEACKITNEEQLKKEISKYSKLDVLKDESFGLKPYLTELNVEEARTTFRYRTKNTDLKFNLRNKPEYASTNWQCNSCERAIETNSHVLWCPAYQNLREGKSLESDKDLAQYLMNVLKIREKFKLTR